jgi:hypothetical protein
MRTCVFRLQIASPAEVAVALMVCSGASSGLRAGLRGFRAEAERLALEIDPVTGETLQAMVDHMVGSAREVVDALRRAIGNGEGQHAAIYSKRGRRRGPQHRI